MTGRPGDEVQAGKAQWLACGLLVLTVAVYVQVLGFKFINFDDTWYVTANEWVKGGLSIASLKWAFTATHAGNWHPLTWLSHMLDVELFGLHPGGHHLTSLLLHAASAILLFHFFLKTTRRAWPSFFVAAAFALHPLHVESVAWVAERKDVLCAFWWMVTLLAYERYVRRPQTSSYALVLAVFSLGLLSKPMMVTLPFVLLLLDFWPLGRVDCDNDYFPAKDFCTWRIPWQLAIEKIPFFALTAISSVVTFSVQQGAGAVQTLEKYPIALRLSNALVSYWRYLGKTVWPAGLTVVYPEPVFWPLPVALTALMALLGVSFVAVLLARRFPFFPVGWFWYLGTLVPVIGLVQVGDKAISDRYTYIPLIGIFMAVAWSGELIAQRTRSARQFVALLAILAVGVMGALSARQTSYWVDSVTLFRHGLEVAEDTGMAHYNLGLALSHEGRIDEAFGHFQQALASNPGLARAHNHIGVYYAKHGMLTQASLHFKEALRLKPAYPEAKQNLSRLLAIIDKAIPPGSESKMPR